MTDKELMELLQSMSLEEKVGQLVQVTGDALGENGQITGPLGSMKLNDEDKANLGSILAINGAEKLIALQDKQMAQQPHHIPMLFMCDVINGFQTIFPIPLAQGASFDPEETSKCASIAAMEASAAGVHVTFSPMLDLCRDARWGRVMESPGEDAYLNSCMARAMVEGYQGTGKHGPVDREHLAATVKHFAAYGRPEGGRDYDTVELSERTLREDYLPAYAAAVDAGARLVMTSFNTLNRVPSTGNRWLMRDILRGEMNFDGVLISDYSAAEEMVNHGIAEDLSEATRLAMAAGLDIDMVSNCYVHHLADLVRKGDISEKDLDEAVLRVLRLKNDLGLFENPYKAACPEKEREITLCPEFRQEARISAEKSFVLLKNEESCLPLAQNESVAFIGPYAMNHEIFGTWSVPADAESTATIRQAIETMGISNATFCQGSFLMDNDQRNRFGQTFAQDIDQAEKWLEEAKAAAADSDKVVLCVGEMNSQSGECGSRATLRIPECQQHLIEEIAKVNSNIIVVLFTGRPLETKEITKYAKSLVVVWFPGTEGGSAIADVLYGISEPGGRLPMTFPRTATQEPIYYNQLPTGRPNPSGHDLPFLNGYIDEETTPEYCFGQGMTYTTFSYSKPEISGRTLKKGGKATLSVTVKNTGKRKGTETVQLYIHDIAASVSRPQKMLKGFRKITLDPGESASVQFEITEEMLRFYDINMQYVSEPGKFDAYVGGSSLCQDKVSFTLE